MGSQAVLRHLLCILISCGCVHGWEDVLSNIAKVGGAVAGAAEIAKAASQAVHMKETASESLSKFSGSGGFSAASPEQQKSWFGLGTSETVLGTYDMVADISDLEAIMDPSRGWPLTVRDASSADALMNGKLIKVAIIGNYNKGKTTIMNKMAGKEVTVGNLVHTEGLSVALKDKIAFLDTAGENQPLDLLGLDNDAKQAKINQRLLSGLFLQQLVQDMADVLVVVVNQLSCEDQRYIRVLEERMEKRSETNHKTMLIVHNFKDAELDKDVRTLIDKDVVKGFEAFQDSILDKTYWKTKEGVAHVVFAREGTAAGKVWNKQSMEFMQHFIQSKGSLKDSILEASILGRLMNFTMETLPRYFTNLKKSDFFPTKTNNASRALFLLNNKRFFVGPQFATELKRDAKIVEWEILYQSIESPYTLDYEILQAQSETIVRIDIPGVFPDGKDTKVTERTLRSKGIGPDDFFWSQGDRQLVQITGRKVFHNGKAPGLDIMVSRRDAINETNTNRIMETKLSRGVVKLTIPLKQDSEKGGPDAFDKVHAVYQDNGIMVVTFVHPGEQMEEPVDACKAGGACEAPKEAQEGSKSRSWWR